MTVNPHIRHFIFLIQNIFLPEVEGLPDPTGRPPKDRLLLLKLIFFHGFRQKTKSKLKKFNIPLNKALDYESIFNVNRWSEWKVAIFVSAASAG